MVNENQLGGPMIQKEAPCLTRGCHVTLIKKPAGYLSQHVPLTLGNTYEFLEWSGSCVVITTDIPGETTSVHYSHIAPV
ncbi:MAG: hypothetical protein WC791_00575 [Candidatus Paceibacterota bacterium]|jgi:hypothetical protein